MCVQQFTQYLYDLSIINSVPDCFNAADDPELESPYVKAAKAEGLDLPWWEKIQGAKFENGRFSLKELLGGKLDDITVLVARVTDAPPVVEEVADAEEPSEESSDAPKPESSAE